MSDTYYPREGNAPAETLSRRDYLEETCQRCDGQKTIRYKGKKVPCPRCIGTGTVVRHRFDPESGVGNESAEIRTVRSFTTEQLAERDAKTAELKELLRHILLGPRPERGIKWVCVDPCPKCERAVALVEEIDLDTAPPRAEGA